VDKPEEVESEVAQSPPSRYPIDLNQPGLFPLHCHYHLTKNMLNIYTDTVFVAVVIDSVLLCPPSISIPLLQPF